MYCFKPLFLSAALTFTVGLSASAQTPQDTLLSPTQIRADITLAKEAYSRVHPGYTRYTSEAVLNASWEAVNSKAASREGLTLGEFYTELQNVLAGIRCDHTKAELPKAIGQDRNITPVYLPVIWRVIEGRGFIENPGTTGLSRGDEIISIDGRALRDLMNDVRPLIPFDGNTGFVRDIHMGASLEFMGGAVDHFGALLWDISPMAALTVKTKNGDLKTSDVNRILHKDWKALLQDGKTSTDFPDAITFDRIGDKAAYLRIDSFVNYRQPVKPDSLYDPIFSAIKSEGRDQLILDLRENGGGSTDAKTRLFAHLIKKKNRLVKDTQVKTLDHSGLEPYISTWETRLINPNKLGFKKNANGAYSLRKIFADDTKMIRPDKTAFAGQLYVLTSSSNGSATTALLAKLKDMDNVTLIGEETGGSAEGTTAGVLFYLKLPESGIRTRIPVMQDFNDVTSFVPGKGITPDILAPMTANAFLDGKDPAYERALKMITKE